MTSYVVNVQVIMFTVLSFYWEIFKLGLKIRSFSKSTYPGLPENVLTCIPRWLEGKVVVAQTTLNRWGVIVIDNLEPTPYSKNRFHALRPGPGEYASCVYYR